MKSLGIDAKTGLRKSKKCHQLCKYLSDIVATKISLGLRGIMTAASNSRSIKAIPRPSFFQAGGLNVTDGAENLF